MAHDWRDQGCCYCPRTEKQRGMPSGGFERDRGSIDVWPGRAAVSMCGRDKCSVQSCIRLKMSQGPSRLRPFRVARIAGRTLTLAVRRWSGSTIAWMCLCLSASLYLEFSPDEGASGHDPGHYAGHGVGPGEKQQAGRIRSLVGTAHPAENPQDHNQCPEQWRVPRNRSVWHKHKTPYVPP